MRASKTDAQGLLLLIYEILVDLALPIAARRDAAAPLFAMTRCYNSPVGIASKAILWPFAAALPSKH